MTRTALYRHFDASGALLYVGISDSPASRLRQHLAASPWAGDIASVTLAWFDDRQAALCAETIAIMTEKPLYNRKSLALSFDEAMPTAKLLTEIADYLFSTGMSKSVFGMTAIGDPGFVFGLEKGREPRSRVVSRVREYMRDGVTYAASKVGAS